MDQSSVTTVRFIITLDGLATLAGSGTCHGDNCVGLVLVNNCERPFRAPPLSDFVESVTDSEATETSTDRGGTSLTSNGEADRVRTGLTNLDRKGLLLCTSSVINGFFEGIASAGRATYVAAEPQLVNGLFDSGTVFFSKSPFSDCWKYVMVTGLDGHSSAVAPPGELAAGIATSTTAGTGELAATGLLSLSDTGSVNLSPPFPFTIHGNISSRLSLGIFAQLYVDSATFCVSCFTAFQVDR